MSDISLGFKTTGFVQVGLVEIPKVFYQRFATGIKLFDSLLGGDGFLPGSTFTVTGKAGSGKTTFLLQMLESLQQNGKVVGLCSGEQNINQIAFNCKRLNINNVQIANITDIDTIVDSMKYFDIIIIDSFQFLTCSHIDKPLALQRYAIKSLVQAAQQHECILGIVQHLTTIGTAKGGTLVPHTVDMNLELVNDEEDETIKTIRIYKNRFGKCGEIKLKMTDVGFDFEHEIKTETTAKYTESEKRGTKEEQQILEYINKRGEATLIDIYGVVGESWRVQYYLRKFINEHKIKKEGRGKTAVWKRIERKEG